MPETIGSPAMFGAFICFVIAMLALDLGVFHRHAHTVAFKEALGWSVFWIGLALAFNVGVYFWFGSQTALEFTTAYLIEKALSVDNIFVMLVLMSYFRVPAEYQHRVLFWGILGALVMRGVFIALGAALLVHFHWIIYVFGALLIFTGVKMLFLQDHSADPSKSWLFQLIKRVIPATPTLHGQAFFICENNRLLATPLFFALVAVEITDLVFAVDSIPAVFAITPDPFIVFTSNVFAILGLRALFFLLAGVMQKFHYLKAGLALVLVFVGGKMAGMDWFKIPIAISLAVIAVLIGASIAASVLFPPPQSQDSPGEVRP